MAKSSPSLTLLLAAALAVLPATLHGAKKKKAVTKIQPATKTKRTPAPDDAPATTPALPGATPRPRMEDLEQILDRPLCRLPGARACRGGRGGAKALAHCIAGRLGQAIEPSIASSARARTTFAPLLTAEALGAV